MNGRRRRCFDEPTHVCERGPVQPFNVLTSVVGFGPNSSSVRRSVGLTFFKNTRKPRRTQEILEEHEESLKNTRKPPINDKCCRTFFLLPSYLEAILKNGQNHEEREQNLKEHGQNIEKHGQNLKVYKKNSENTRKP